jgi:hypothetical protein
LVIMVDGDPLEVEKAGLKDAEAGLARLSDLARAEHWPAEERAALADEQDTVADAADSVAEEFDERADRSDDEGQTRESRTDHRTEHAIAKEPRLEPGPYLRYQADRDRKGTQGDRQRAAEDRARSAYDRQTAADSRQRAAADREEAASHRAVADESVHDH